MINAVTNAITHKLPSSVKEINRAAIIASGALTLGAYYFFGPLGGLVASAVPAALAYRSFTTPPPVNAPVPTPEPPLDPVPETTLPIPSTSEPKPPLTKRSWYSLIGLLQFLFDLAIYVRDGDQRYYLNVSEIVSQLPVKNASKKIHTLVLEILHPVLGLSVERKQVDSLLEEMHDSPLNEVEKKLEKIKKMPVPAIPYDPVELAKRLKPGDILFKRIDESMFHRVVWGQHLVQPTIRGEKERGAYNYSHVAMYVGDGQVAEAVPEDEKRSEVRIISLANSHFALMDKHQYLISRPKDESLGQEAAIIARRIAIPVVEGHETETVHKYSKMKALLSLFCKSNFGPFARRKYVENYYDIHAKKLPKDFLGLKKYFCSYFAGYCYQAAESQRVLPTLFGENDKSPKTALARREKSRWKYLTKWREMSKAVKLQFDAERLTPQDFRNFIIRNPNQFRDILLVDPKVAPARSPVAQSPLSDQERREHAVAQAN